MWELYKVRAQGEREEPQLIAYSWKMNNTGKLVMINLKQEPSGGWILLDDILPGMDYVFRDELSGERYTAKGSYSAGTGLEISLEAFQTRIFDMPYGDNT